MFDGNMDVCHQIQTLQSTMFDGNINIHYQIHNFASTPSFLEVIAFLSDAFSSDGVIRHFIL